MPSSFPAPQNASTTCRSIHRESKNGNLLCFGHLKTNWRGSQHYLLLGEKKEESRLVDVAAPPKQCHKTTTHRWKALLSSSFSWMRVKVTASSATWDKNSPTRCCIIRQVSFNSYKAPEKNKEIEKPQRLVSASTGESVLSGLVSRHYFFQALINICGNLQGDGRMAQSNAKNALIRDGYVTTRWQASFPAM